MHLRIGGPAPEFQARSDDGQHVSSASLAGGWAVVFFFPKSGTTGCRLEARQFQQVLPEFGQLNTRIIGVSTDTEAKQALFREQCQLSFPLLPDGDRTIGRAFGVVGLLGLAKRQTFLIDPQGRLAHHWRSVQPAQHAAEVLEKIRTLQAAATATGR
ncbi:peroxiredoxin [Deinococcus sp. KNUC1210]|uniref:peroxiredoxin n=1 Tax=Deinococcus sp. KNUC1210 TaxID=2917691 RepID=UPI001EF0F833|nr:peroxiredoxin [Deinococcus sp. KNUC1210]ULH16258.1 peroxiredoxin [Deinococcus sp. KNUC1210]